MLNIFVNTWGNYNENGADGGQWITLPMDADELEETLENIAEQMGDDDPEWAIHDYEWTTAWEGRCINEHENIADINEYVQALDDLDEWEQKVYCAAVECWGTDYVEPDDVNDYILMEDVQTDYDLGYYWAEESGCYTLEGPLANYFDYEAFGRDIRFETDGMFTSFGWIEKC